MALISGFEYKVTIVMFVVVSLTLHRTPMLATCLNKFDITMPQTINMQCFIVILITSNVLCMIYVIFGDACQPKDCKKKTHTDAHCHSLCYLCIIDHFVCLWFLWLLWDHFGTLAWCSLVPLFGVIVATTTMSIFTADSVCSWHFPPVSWRILRGIFKCSLKLGSSRCFKV